MRNRRAQRIALRGVMVIAITMLGLSLAAYSADTPPEKAKEAKKAGARKGGAAKKTEASAEKSKMASEAGKAGTVKKGESAPPKTESSPTPSAPLPAILPIAAPTATEASSPSAAASAPAKSATASPPVAAPAETAPSPTKAAAPSVGATPQAIPMVPSALVGRGEGAPTPPPTRPELQPIPASEGSVTYVGRLSKDSGISIPALIATGKGEIEIKGEAAVRLFGDGALWADNASSVTLDPATTGTKTREDNGWGWAGFRGTARVSGSPAHLKMKGDRLMVQAQGRGTVTLRGDSGIFRLTQAGGQLVSGVWDPAGITKDFATLEAESTTGTIRTMRVRPGASATSIIPASPPPGRVYTRPQLPSERGTTVPSTAPSPAAPPVPVPATTTAPAQNK